METEERDDLELLTIPLVQQKLKVGRTTIYNLFDSGRLRSVKVGHSRRVLSSELSRYINSLATEEIA